MSTVTLFSDDDPGYLAWLADHPDGYVINIARSRSVAAARVHRAGCRTIRGENPVGGGWTRQYVKKCADQLAELEQWAIHEVGQHIPPCGACHPHGVAAQPTSVKKVNQTFGSPLPDGGCEVRGPTADRPVVEAWADDYIRFERRPAWQERLRTEIRDGCGRLEPSAGQVLQAT